MQRSLAGSPDPHDRAHQVLEEQLQHRPLGLVVLLHVTGPGRGDQPHDLLRAERPPGTALRDLAERWDRGAVIGPRGQEVHVAVGDMSCQPDKAALDVVVLHVEEHAHQPQAVEVVRRQEPGAGVLPGDDLPVAFPAICERGAPRFGPADQVVEVRGEAHGAAQEPGLAPPEVQVGEGVEVRDARGAQQSHGRRVQADQLQAPLPGALRQAYGAAHAGVALAVDAVAEIVQVGRVDAGQRPVGGEQAPQVPHLLVEVQGRQRKGVLHLVGALVYAGHHRLEDRVVVAASPEDHAVALQDLPQHDAVRRQLDAVVGLVLTAGLALHDAQVRDAVHPPENEEVHAAGQEELAHRPLDLHLAGEAVGARRKLADPAKVVVPGEPDLPGVASRIEERYRPPDGIGQLPLPLPAAGREYGIQRAANATVEGEAPGDLGLVDAELEAPLAPVLVDVFTDVGDDHLTLRAGHPLPRRLDGKGRLGY